MGGIEEITREKDNLDVISQYSKFFKKIDTFTGTCPSCGKSTFTIVEFTYNTPYGNILVISGYCETCGYKFSDILNLDIHRPIKLILEIKEPNDLRSLIIRSKTAKIILPDFGVEVYPGPAALPYITTVDGLLYRILDVLELFSNGGNRCKQLKNTINSAIKGKRAFTLIIEDPYGNSAIIPYQRSRLTIEYIKV